MLKRAKDILLRMPPLFRNIFFLTGLVFAAWMLFFDESNMLVQYNRMQELRSLNKKRGFYKTEIAKVEKQYHELTTNAETQEKFARENYMMKKDNEEVFVIVPK